MNFLGIDVGTGGSRAILIDENGANIATATAQHVPFSSPNIGWAEQNPEDWWQACVSAIQTVLKNENVRAEEIAAISFSGQMHGAVLLDKADAVLRPAIIWCDQRTEAECFEITELIGAERLIDLTCNPAVTGFTLPKLLWIRKHEPEIWKKAKSVLLPKDYVRFRLSGDKASDVADASGTLLFDVKNRCWSEEILSAFEIDRKLLPTVFESIEITGKISKAGAQATGLIEGTLIVAGAGDNAAGAVGMGVVTPGTVSATIGTSGVVFGVTNAPLIDPKGRIHTLCHAIPGRWHNTGVTQSAGLSLRWFRDNFESGKTYDELVKQAETVGAGSDGAIWLPYLMGERTPYLDAKARAAFIGLTASHTAAHLIRAVLEGVAFSLRDAMEIFKGLNVPIETIRLGGGGARSLLWQQIQADVYGQTVETIEADEGAAFGAALLSGVGAGEWKTVDEACAKTIRVSKQIKPNKKSVEVLNQNYRAYKLLYSALRPAVKIITEQ
jgi:xylulokinase